jgi:hypothetical protein
VRRGPFIAASALVLAGCADVSDKSAALPACERSAKAGQPVTLQVSGPGVVIDGIVIPGRDLGGSGKLDRDWGNAPGCIRQEQNGRKPKLYDLHKIGMAV